MPTLKECGYDLVRIFKALRDEEIRQGRSLRPVIVRSKQPQGSYRWQSKFHFRVVFVDKNTGGETYLKNGTRTFMDSGTLLKNMGGNTRKADRAIESYWYGLAATLAEIYE